MQGEPLFTLSPGCKACGDTVVAGYEYCARCTEEINAVRRAAIRRRDWFLQEIHPLSVFSQEFQESIYGTEGDAMNPPRGIALPPLPLLPSPKPSPKRRAGFWREVVTEVLSALSICLILFCLFML